jgi:hypothetical protein
VIDLRVGRADAFIVTTATGDGQKSNHDRREPKTLAQASHHITSQRYEHWLSEAHSTAKRIAARAIVHAIDPICDVDNARNCRTQIGRKKDSRLWISRPRRKARTTTDRFSGADRRAAARCWQILAAQSIIGAAILPRKPRLTGDSTWRHRRRCRGKRTCWWRQRKHAPEGTTRTADARRHPLSIAVARLSA